MESQDQQNFHKHASDTKYAPKNQLDTDIAAFKMGFQKQAFGSGRNAFITFYHYYLTSKVPLRFQNQMFRP